MADKDPYQHVPENTASDRVAEKAELLKAKMAEYDKQIAAEAALHPPAPAPKKVATK